MKLFIKDIVSASGGRLSEGRPDLEIKGVSIDSRTLKKGEIFFALKGKNFNGHSYLGDVFSRGACGAVIEEGFGGREGFAFLKGESGERGGGNFSVVSVQDTLLALGKAALFVRDGSKRPLIAVSGTSGKTTTKEMIASIAGQSENVLKTAGNMNNLIGLPLTLLSLNSVHSLIVVELGISEPGEMKRLSGICRPDIAVITNIGRAHLEKLRTEEGVAKEKVLLYDSLGKGGVRVVNTDDPLLTRFTEGRGGEKITFGRKDGADVLIKEYFCDTPSTLTAVYEVRGKTVAAKIASPFLSNVYNGAAAIAALLPIGVKIADIEKGFLSFAPVRGRMEVLRIGGWTVLDDTYNANPSSVEAALKTLSSFNGRKVAVLGDMLELGEGSEGAHLEAGRIAADCGIDAIVTVGRFGDAVKQGAVDKGMKKEDVFSFSSNEEASEELKRILKEGDTVLVKGSRGARMEDIIEALIGRRPGRRPGVAVNLKGRE